MEPMRPKKKDVGGVSEEAKLKNYVVYAPPVFGKLQAPFPKYPMPGESYNYKQMVDVLSIFDKRWKSAGSAPDREPFAVSSNKDGLEELEPHKFTRDVIYSSIASDAYIEAVAYPDDNTSSSNKLLSELLSLDWSDKDTDDFEDDDQESGSTMPQGGGASCPKRKPSPKGKAIKKRKSAR
jgi:hypothetical protein